MLEQGGLGAGEALHAGRAEGGMRLLQSPPGAYSMPQDKGVGARKRVIK